MRRRIHLSLVGENRGCRPGFLPWLVLLLALLPFPVDAAREVSRSTPADASPVIRLPPYIVEHFVELHWQYARIPGFAVLTSCTESATQQLIEQNDRLRQLLEMLLPKELQPRLGRPVTLIVFPRNKVPTKALQMADLVHRSVPVSAVQVRLMPNFRCARADAMALCYIVNENNIGSHVAEPTLGHFEYLLRSRVPSLPQWFVDGMIELYPGLSVTTNFTVGTVGDVGPPAVRSDSFDQQVNQVVFKPLVWLSEAESEAIRRLGKHRGRRHRPTPDVPAYLRRHHEWIPLPAMFAPRPPDRDPAAPLARVRRMEAALFIRWAFDGGKTSRRKALWRFVADTCSRPPTEGVFKSCFGLDYAAVETRLQAYLPEAVDRGFELTPPDLKEAPQAKFQRATGDEIARLKGQFERLEAAYVRRVYPTAAAAYEARALKTLRKAYDAGDRNPELLAELGLCECDAGHDAAARPLLEAAVRADVDRPRVYLELARIRFAELIRRKEAGPLTPAGVNDVIGLIETARHQVPPLANVYELLAGILITGKMNPSPERYAELDEGVRLFPREVRLLFATALLNAAHHREPRARALVDQALQVAGDPADRTRLLKLQTLLKPASAARS